ncbi:AraC family transcriptional regulator [Cohnella sp.]|uniref:AraC family transcriptional regulator n=1 Tax=Cohnella sp. TaxID=1883426 RepID=UPI003704460F
MFAHQLEFIFFYVHKPDTQILSHHHKCYELVYYISGSGTTNIGGKEYEYADNMFSLMRPDTYHSETHDTGTELFCIGFTLNDTEVIDVQNGVYPDRSCQLLQIVKRMKQELLSKRLHYNLKLDLLLSEFLIEFERTRSLSSASDSFRYIENFILENFNQNINLPALAKVSGYSYDHFRHMFKERTGLSPMNYIIDKRIDYAKRLIVSTDMTLSTISQECGFSTSSQFSSMFRRLTGRTPSEYRLTGKRLVRTLRAQPE